jgi:PKD repeat protein
MTVMVPVQSVEGSPANSTTPDLTATPTVGNVIFLWKTWGVSPPGLKSGFTSVAQVSHTGNTRYGHLMYRVVQSGDTVQLCRGNDGQVGVRYAVSEWPGSFDGVSFVARSNGTNGGTPGPFICGGALTPPAGDDYAIVGFACVGQGSNEGIITSLVPGSGVTEEQEIPLSGNATPWSWVGYMDAPLASGAYTVGGTINTGDSRQVRYSGVTVAVVGTGIPNADFTSDVTSVLEGGTVAFTDLSSRTPTSWAWTFGDGGTSTSQDPTHVYAVAGSYTVSLTATNANGADTETKTSYVSVSADVGYVPPVPAPALLEIYAAEPGSARWGVAHWGEDVWSQAGWQDVTPQGVTVDIAWGSSRPELGILSVPDAASWAVDYYDPDRLLDPANLDSPYFGDLVPYLPLRLSHRGIVVRVGYATGISHDYANDRGYMRGADQITRLANADVPTDSTLPDTLYARAVAAISAAGLSVEVQTPVGTDPPVSPWIIDTREWTAWEWIKDAAQEVLHIPYIDRYGTLCFRPWATPLARGRSVDSPELVGLQVVTDYSGNYSVVQARFDATTITERALTPPPRYGARTYLRDEITIDEGAWADAVLADRGLPSLRWLPGDIRPDTADSTERIATLEAVERIGMSVTEQDPNVFVTGIIVGGEIMVRGLVPDTARWRFRLQVAQTTDEPLIESGGAPTDYLLDTGGAEFLYPSS